MSMISLVFAFSAVLWFLIDRFKPMWANLSFGKWITLAISAIGSFGLAFGFNLDLIHGFGLSELPTVMGTIVTGFVLMSGSSATAEIIERIKGGKIVELTEVLDFLDAPEDVEDID